VKVLVDSCIASSVAPALSSAGHDVECVSDWPADPGDAEVLGRAKASGRVVLTLDKDFGDLVVVRGQAHAGIVRLVGFSTGKHRCCCRGLEHVRARACEWGHRDRRPRPYASAADIHVIARRPAD
jgi:predicted nuclease of predicted toxin-antitoxin system